MFNNNMGASSSGPSGPVNQSVIEAVSFSSDDESKVKG
jgi:hypothetical protein